MAADGRALGGQTSCSSTRRMRRTKSKAKRRSHSPKSATRRRLAEHRFCGRTRVRPEGGVGGEAAESSQADTDASATSVDGSCFAGPNSLPPFQPFVPTRPLAATTPGSFCRAATPAIAEDSGVFVASAPPSSPSLGALCAPARRLRRPPSPPPPPPPPSPPSTRFFRTPALFSPWRGPGPCSATAALKERVGRVRLARGDDSRERRVVQRQRFDEGLRPRADASRVARPRGCTPSRRRRRRAWRRSGARHDRDALAETAALGRIGPDSHRFGKKTPASAPRRHRVEESRRRLGGEKNGTFTSNKRFWSRTRRTKEAGSSARIRRRRPARPA